mmetsp:Transcript_2315/g.2023  ORF Transcript_2315/g.2023 Transcript_2315/m.2023 type:complete len:107 (+) Transcript_2315:16-336(+)
MSNHKGISRTLLGEFNELKEAQPDDNEPKPETKPSKKPIKSSKTSDEGKSTPKLPKRDYETRNRSKNNGKSDRQGGGKPVLKPRQENSLGELTKKFIHLIKQTDDY